MAKKQTTASETSGGGGGPGGEHEGGDKTVVYTDIQQQFLDLLKKYPVNLPETIVDYVTSQGENVLEDPVMLAKALRECEISPVRRHQILRHWFADKGLQVSEDILNWVASNKPFPPEGDNKDINKKAKDKFSVDNETGSIVVASSPENAVSYEEALKLSEKRKGELKEKEKGQGPKYVYDPDTKAIRMARDGEQGGTMDEAKELKKMAEEGTRKGGSAPLYVYDAVEKVVRMAKDGEQGGTLDEAKELKRLAELDNKSKDDKGVVKYVYDADAKVIRMAKEGEPGGTFDDAERLKRMAEGDNKDKGESPFTMDSNGAILIIPGAKLNAQDLMVWLSLQKPASGDSEAMKELKLELQKMREEQHAAELRQRDQMITNLTTQAEKDKTELLQKMEELKKDQRTTGKTIYDIVERFANKFPDSNDAIKALQTITQNPPRFLPGGPGDVSKRLESAAGKLEEAGALKKAGDAWFNLQ